MNNDEALISNGRMRLARMLDIYLAASGIEQKIAANAIGINQSTLSRFIAGKQLPAADAFARILTWITDTSFHSMQGRAWQAPVCDAKGCNRRTRSKHGFCFQHADMRHRINLPQDAS